MNNITYTIIYILYISGVSQFDTSHPPRSNGPGYQAEMLDLDSCQAKKSLKCTHVYQGSLNGTHFLGNQTMQIYGNFEGFSLIAMHCLGW